jgi:YVTN family beta-propeller protein
MIRRIGWQAVCLVLTLQFLVTSPASAAGITGTISVGTMPYGVALNSATNTIYVANAVSPSNAVTVIGGETNSVSGTVNLDSVPFLVAVNPTTDSIYVTNINSNTVTVIKG